MAITGLAAPPPHRERPSQRIVFKTIEMLRTAAVPLDVGGMFWRVSGVNVRSDCIKKHTKLRTEDSAKNIPRHNSLIYMECYLSMPGDSGVI
jgi:hypothetical protein